MRVTTHRRAHRGRARLVRTLLLALAAPALALGCRPGGAPAPDLASRVAPSFPAGWPLAAGAPASRGREAMIASSSREASEAGLEILRAGGNAMDAAVAVGFALAVSYPQAGNIGGGGFMVIRMADGRIAAIDYREVAPLAATRDMYLGPDGRLTSDSRVGHRASGVPGAVAGMAAALQRFGTMPLARVMAPAIRLATEGIVVDSALHMSLRESAPQVRRFAGADMYFPGGQPLAVGSTWKQPDLARTLRLIAEQGPRAFYQGEIADSLVAEMQRGGGIISKADLARYKPEWREPIRSTYRGHRFYAMPPASSGGITMTELLNIVEARGATPPFGSAAYVHLLGEASRRAFIDRNAKIADPAFVPVPQAELTSKEYARRLAAGISATRATPTPEATAQIGDGTSTTHYSVVDAQGNAVSTTTTLNDSYGSGVWVRGAGFLLNDEMDDFAAQPGQPNMFGLVQGEANAIAPGKRMLSAMSPTIVLDPRGQLLMVVGAAGGPRIITTTAQLMLNVIDHRMTLMDAMRAPRLHHQALPDSLTYEQHGVTPAVRDSLQAMGHALRTLTYLATANAILRVPGGWEGVSEPRSRYQGGAVGY
jgi:gamma-glutamyltranspeptidase/glutathione hydrolase